MYAAADTDCCHFNERGRQSVLPSCRCPRSCPALRDAHGGVGEVVVMCWALVWFPACVLHPSPSPERGQSARDHVTAFGTVRCSGARLVGLPNEGTNRVYGETAINYPPHPRQHPTRFPRSNNRQQKREGSTWPFSTRRSQPGSAFRCDDD